jgi:hypothetical protein
VSKEPNPAPSEPEEPAIEPQVYVPKPPSPEASEEISRQQALITDEWSGEPPNPSKPG